MKNKVGEVVPSEAEIAALIDQVKAVEEAAKPFTIVLSRDERGETTKMRTGGEGIATLVGNLAKEHGVTLPKISVEGMKADLLLVERLRTLQTVVDGLSQRLADTILEAQSEAWWTATALYTSLARMTGADAELERSLKPAVDFFAIGRRKKPEEPKGGDK